VSLVEAKIKEVTDKEVLIADLESRIKQKEERLTIIKPG